MASIPFDYARMWRHYFDGRVGVASDSVVLHVYSANYVAMKYDRDGTVAPFHHRGTRAFALSADDPLRRHCSHYVVDMDTDAERAARKKQAFFVRPQERLDASGERLLFADHLSFVLDKNDRNTPLHLHLTTYVPNPTLPNRGGTQRVFNKLPASFALPVTPEGFGRSGLLHALLPVAEWVHAATTRPWSEFGDGDGGDRVGGGGRAGRRRRRRRPALPERATFDDLWRALPLHRLEVFVIERRDGRFDVSVAVHDRLHLGGKRRREGAMAFGAHLPGLDADVVDDQARLRAAVAGAFRDLRVEWDTFVHPPPPGSEDDDA